MGRKESIQHALCAAALQDVSDKSVGIYKHDIKVFADYARQHGVKDAESFESGNKRGLIQSYADLLLEQGKSPSTIHRYIAPVCKGAGINMADIEKPKRTIDRITRSRYDTANKQGDIEQSEDRFKRLVDFQKAVGIRRAELARLKPADIIQLQDGRVYVHVARGKGGKEQYQAVLPDNIDIVLKTRDTATGERLFSKDEINNKIDLHALRADNAKAAYKYYADKLQESPGLRNQYAHMLQRYFYDMNKRLRESSQKQYNARLAAFKRDMYQSSGIYKIRGASVDIAREKGLPVEYDRMALMMTSVFHLSHWRNDVTVINYML
ncbi:hypothetical protein [Lachnospira eligens]|jgi:hypothetical protein|uniref:hypothetical protein n=1 Tax=Lachnospira eligens TaxID=39485 RepID=UPI000E5D9C3A|nr:hypothetical protein [Lachnospira eligens]RGZ68091.1 hypothetical protein DW976_14275 [Lachnospira eligens]